MKRVTLLAALAGAVGLVQTASAADLAVKAAPPPAPLSTWTGFYIGVHGGAAWQSAPSWSVANPNIPATSTLTSSPGLGGVGGLQAGYNYQFAPAWMVGVEGDISWASLGDNRTTRVRTATVVLPPPIAISMSANTQWLASARARIGFTGWFNNTLLYATGGAAWTSREYDANKVDTLNGDTHHFSSDTTKTGWVVGGGGEWQATTNILLRAEYLYYNFNNAFSASVPGTTVGGTPILTQLPTTYTWNSYNVQVARVAVSYKF